MAQVWRNPYNRYKPWSLCQTCGQSWPSQKITYNPRFGWQCPPCWDGLIQHDQYDPPVFPYEGTRKVNSPIVNSLTEGIAPGSLFQTYIYNFRDRATGQIWLVHMVPLTINGAGSLAFLGAHASLTLGLDPLQPIFDGLVWTNGYDIYVNNGVLSTESYNPLSPLSRNMLQGVCDFGAVSAAPVGFFLYDRSHPQDIYQVIFHGPPPDPIPNQIEVLPASGPAVGGILLNNAPDGSTWSYFIDQGQAWHNHAPYSPQIVWDNSHQFYVDNATQQLVYFP